MAVNVSSGGFPGEEIYEEEIDGIHEEIDWRKRSKDRPSAEITLKDETRKFLS